MSNRWVKGLLETRGYLWSFTSLELIYDPCLSLSGTLADHFTHQTGVAKVIDGITGAQQTEAKGKPPKVRVRGVTTYDQALLDNVNQHIATTQPESLIRVDAVVPSDIHPHDGLAFRMNLHSDNSTLHIHTNGSSCMALFHDDDTTSLFPRAKPLPTDGHHFHFTGMGGMKAEWHNINHDPDGAEDFPKIMNAFVLSNLQPKHIMETANAWDFQACNKAKTATFAWGRFWFKHPTAKLKYEAASPRGCNS